MEELARFGIIGLKLFRMPAEVDDKNFGPSVDLNPFRESNIYRADTLDLTYYYNDGEYTVRDNTVESNEQSAVSCVRINERYVSVYYYTDNTLFGGIKPLPADEIGYMGLPDGYSASVTVNSEPTGIDFYAYEIFKFYVFRFTFYV